MSAPRRALPRAATAHAVRRDIPAATVARLPLYLRVLTGRAQAGQIVSSSVLADQAGVSPAQLRKDLSHLGSYGTRGVGYDAGYLVDRITAVLGVSRDWRVVIVGVGNLGQALAGHPGFSPSGVSVVALLDSSPALIGRVVAGLRVRDEADLERVVTDLDIAIGVIAVPAGSAQQVCDRLVGCGVTSVLNFAPTVLQVPAEVTVRQVDLSSELQLLAFHEQRRAADRAAADATVAVGAAR